LIYMLTRNGYKTQDSKELKEQLTVKPNDYGFYKSPSFKVYRLGTSKSIYVPRFFGEVLGKPLDVRKEPKDASIPFRGILRDYQTEALSKYNGHGVLSLPCGFGKTCTALAICAKYKTRTLIVVHKEFLANQWKENIRQWCPGSSIGTIQGDTFDIEHDFVIGMIQTLSQRVFEKDAFDSIGMIVVDEAHHIGAPSFSQFMFKLCPKYTLGLTATPERKDGLTRLLYWFLGPEFYSIVQNNLDNVIVYKVPFKSPLYKGYKSYVDIQSLIIDIDNRNKIIYDICINNTNRCILILSDRRNHCETLQSMIPNSSLYMGGMKRDQLEDSEKSNVIIGTYSLAHEGLDIKKLDMIILATPKADVKQSIGRIMRGSKDPVIYDIIDDWGPLYGMWNKRRDLYMDMGFTITSYTIQ